MGIKSLSMMCYAYVCVCVCVYVWSICMCPVTHARGLLRSCSLLSVDESHQQHTRMHPLFCTIIRARAPEATVLLLLLTLPHTTLPSSHE